LHELTLNNTFVKMTIYYGLRTCKQKFLIFVTIMIKNHDLL